MAPLVALLACSLYWDDALVFAIAENIEQNPFSVGIRIIAIYQETSDDPMGHFVEGIFELVDQYESDVNRMRTPAAMHKNAELGFHNGSKAPYGFVAEPVEVRPGKIKRRLVPNRKEVPSHNEVIRQYIAHQGVKAAAREMNQRGYHYTGVGGSGAGTS
jgi:DNA invertase Pin-like site-specific DNA recombinase